jgi:hypothetical protein
MFAAETITPAKAIAADSSALNWVINSLVDYRLLVFGGSNGLLGIVEGAARAHILPNEANVRDRIKPSQGRVRAIRQSRRRNVEKLLAQPPRDDGAGRFDGRPPVA